MNAESLGEKQPMKLAAMEAQWESEANAPLNLILWPDAENERNSIEALPVPNLLSLLAHYDANEEVLGLETVPPEDRPPVLPTFLSFRVMVGLAFLFVFLSAWAWLKRRDPTENPLLLKIMLGVVAVFVPLVLIYQFWVYKTFPFKIGAADLESSEAY